MKKIIVLLSLVLSTQVYSAVPQLTNLTSAQISSVITDFASDFVPTNVSGASSLGDIIGFRVGLIGGLTDAPGLSDLTMTQVDKLPVLGAYARLGIPFGVSFDLTILPIDLAGFTYKYNSIGTQWTFTDLLEWPLEMQLRLNYTTAKLAWQVDDALLSSTVTYDHSSFNMALVISKKFLFIEPYIGFGRVSGSNDLTAVGTATIFDSSVSQSQRVGVDTKDNYYFLGIDVNLLLVQVGAEYAKNFSNQRISGRISFGF